MKLHNCAWFYRSHNFHNFRDFSFRKIWQSFNRVPEGMQMRLCPLANENARYNNDKPLSTNENVAFIAVQSPRA